MESTGKPADRGFSNAHLHHANAEAFGYGANQRFI
jgi:hypothetical protein